MGDKRHEGEKLDLSENDQDDPGNKSFKGETDPGSSPLDSAAQRLRQTLSEVGNRSAELKGRGDWVYKENNDLKAEVKELREKNAELNNEVKSLREEINFATTQLESVNKALLGLMDHPPLAE